MFVVGCGNLGMEIVFDFVNFNVKLVLVVCFFVYILFWEIFGMLMFVVVMWMMKLFLLWFMDMFLVWYISVMFGDIIVYGF